MADLKISQLTETTNPSGTDVFPIVSEGVTKKVTLSTIYSGGYQGTDLKELSANWQSSYTTVLANSASWATDFTGDTEVRALTANWQETYTTVLENSATNWDNSLAIEYTHINFLPLSGGTITGSLSTTGTLQLSLTSAAPSNTTTPVAWTDIVVEGVTYKTPLYL